MTQTNNFKIEQAFAGVDDEWEWGHLEVVNFGKVQYDEKRNRMIMEGFYFLHFGGPLKYTVEVEAAKAVYRKIATVVVRFQNHPEIINPRRFEHLRVERFGEISLDETGEFKIRGFHLKSKEETKDRGIDISQYVAALLAICEYLEKEIKENCEKEDTA